MKISAARKFAPLPLATIALWLSMLPTAARGQDPPVAVGDQFQVGQGGHPSVAVDPLGDFVVVWQSGGSFGDDSSSNSVQAQRYDAFGAPVGTQFQVNSYTTSSQDSAAITMDGLGNFVVVWQSNGSDGTDTSEESIRAQRFDSAGSPIGAEFQVNTYTTYEQSDPVVAMDTAGNFVVVWESYGSFDTDDSYNSIQGQLFDSNGGSVGGEFQVNTYTTGYQKTAAVTEDGQGNFVVVWQSNGAYARAQRYDGNGAPLGGEFEVETRGYGYDAEVGADAAGNFTVAWTGSEAGGIDDSRSSIETQRFNANGDPVGDQFQVNTYTTDFQENPTIAVDSLGNIVIVWESDIEPGDHILAQYFNANGAPIGGEFQVSTDPYGFKGNPSVGMDGLGEFVVVWDGGYPGGVWGRRFSAGMAIVFKDGFESGDVSAWSSVTP